MSHLYFQKCKQTADTQIINVNKQLTSLRVYINKQLTFLIYVNKQLTFLQLSKQTRLLGHFQPLCQYGDKLFGLGRLFCDVVKHIRIQNQYGCGGFGPIEVLDSHRSNPSTYAKNERQIDGITFYVLASMHFRTPSSYCTLR